MSVKKIQAALMGVVVGDAVGVPFEFRSRAEMQEEPATGLIGYGTYNQPPGTWSDDSSMMLCLAESLLGDYDLADISQKFIDWKEKAYWSARGEVFDIGMTTSKSISQLKYILENGKKAELEQLKYLGDEMDNGNGSLMRILPLLLHVKGRPIQEQFDIIWINSALTHKHIRAGMSCLIYLKMAEYLWDAKDKETAYELTRQDIQAFWKEMDFSHVEQYHFRKVIQNDIRDTPIDEIKTGGYVIESLESCFWFFLQKEGYENTILSIINLGHDTDTSAAIVGGLAGIYYGLEGIPQDWQASMARMEDIMDLCTRLGELHDFE